MWATPLSAALSFEVDGLKFVAALKFDDIDVLNFNAMMNKAN